MNDQSRDIPSEVHGDSISLLDLAALLASNARLLVAVPVLAGALGVGASFLMTPIYTASTTLMQPQQQQSAASALLGSLGGLASMGGAISGLKNPADQWIALLKSRTVADALIKRFNLKELNRAEFQFQVRDKLAGATRITAGRDGLIYIEVDDPDPALAAKLAAAYTEELQRLSKGLAMGEAGQRRLFFEKQLADAKQNLVKAEVALQQQGVNRGLLKMQPQAAVSAIAGIEAQIAAVEVRLSVLQRSMTEQSPLVRQAQTELRSLQSQRSQLEKTYPGAEGLPSAGGDDTEAYTNKYRNFKYYETLFELMARQYEIARADEARDGAVIQVVDAAQVPEWKSRPRRAVIGVASAIGAFLLALVFVVARDGARKARLDPALEGKWLRLRAAFSIRRR